MRIIFILFLIGFIFSSCSKNSRSKFPNEINTEITNEHQRIKGTKIFAKIPIDYEYIKNLSRFEKDDNLYIQFIESNASNFDQAKLNFSKEEIESTGAKVDILQELKLNNLNAFFFDGPSKIPNESKVGFVFGNNEFVVIAVGVYPKNNSSARTEILEILKSIYYQKSFNLDPFELVNFEFDKSITNFKYAMTTSMFLTFNADGNPNSENNFSNSFNIAAMPKLSIEKSNKYMTNIIQNLKNSGKEIKSTKIKTKKIGEYHASILDTEIEIENRNGILYMVMLNGDESNVFFMGTTFERKSEFLEKYKETVKTIKIK